jgi:Peptidase family U32
MSTEGSPLSTTPREFLRGLGLPDQDLSAAPTSTKTFPDGAQYRVEIPSVEGPVALAAVLEEADRRGVTVHRISQGSGGLLTTDAELAEMAALAHDRNVEVSLFTRPTASWDTGAGHLAPTGAALASQARGMTQLVHCLQEITRIAEAGIRSVLVTDLGVLQLADKMRASGVLPATMQMKVSVQMGLANPVSIAIAAAHGADTYNVPTDMSIAQLAAIRSVIDIPIDVYVESPDDLGGFIRHYEIAEIVRVAAPVYVKFGLRNSPFIYPSGSHLEQVAATLARERVRRAQIGLDILTREFPEAKTSKLGAEGLAVPAPPQTSTQPSSGIGTTPPGR